MRYTIIFHFLILIPNLLFSQIKPTDLSQVEPHIAFNPLNFNNIVVTTIAIEENVENWISVFYSTDGGEAWSGEDKFSAPGGADPVIAFDPDGIAYLLYQIRDERALFLHKSSDGGKSWSSPITVVQFDDPQNVDRPWMAISSVRNANGFYDIYVAFLHQTGERR